MKIILHKKKKFNTQYNEYIKINNLLIELNKAIENNSIKTVVDVNKKTKTHHLCIVNMKNPLNTEQTLYSQPLLSLNKLTHKLININILDPLKIIELYNNQINNINIINFGLSYYRLIRCNIIALLYIYMKQTNNIIFNHIYSFLIDRDINNDLEKLKNYIFYFESYNNYKNKLDITLYQNKLIFDNYNIDYQINILKTFEKFQILKLKEMIQLINNHI
jgi:hypothetical protein